MKIKLNYRPDIDGIRAIAVIAVILYHAKYITNEKYFLTGGFFGVDIFFVLSGYLITKLILTEIKKTKKFNFFNFYERRIRRIVPVLLIMIFCTSICAYFLYLPGDLKNFSISTLYTLFFISNYFFLNYTNQYFASDNIFHGLLHTWSLSIEEQFYFFFPVVIFIFNFFIKKKIISLFVLLFFLSIILARFETIHEKSSAFYLIQFRLFEFLPGSMLAYIQLKYSKFNNPFFIKKYGSILGIGLILFSFLFFNEQTRHPSFQTLIPILGTVLLILNSEKKSIIYKIISSSSYVFIGKISFSLYLWHYPIFTYINIVGEDEFSTFKKILLSFSILPLSIVTYFFIEQKFRSYNTSLKKVFLFILIIYGLIILFSVYSLKSDGFQNRYKINENYNLDKSIYAVDREKYLLDYNISNSNLNKERVLIIGNSHADDVLNIFSRIKNIYDKYFFVRPFPQVWDFYMFLDNCNNCDKLKKKNYEKNKNQWSNFYNNSEFIILASKWSQKDLLILDDLIKILKKDKKKVAIMDNSLILNYFTKYSYNDLDYFVSTNKKIPDLKNLNLLEKKVYVLKKKNDATNQILNDIGLKNGLHVFKKNDLLCDNLNQSCFLLTTEQKKIFIDSSHFTNEGAEFFSKRINYISFLHFLIN